MRSSRLASRRGMSLSMSAASAGRPNSIVAEIRESVLKGATLSGASGGLSAATAAEQNPSRLSVTRPASVERCITQRSRTRRDVEISFMIGLRQYKDYSARPALYENAEPWVLL